MAFKVYCASSYIYFSAAKYTTTPASTEPPALYSFKKIHHHKPHHPDLPPQGQEHPRKPTATPPK